MSQETATAIIVAVSALSGVALSQAITFFRERLSRQHQKSDLLREKYEKMALAFLISLRHYTSLQVIKEQKQLFHYAQNFEANKCYFLCDLYFSELRNVALCYLLSYVKLYEAFALASPKLDGKKCLAEIVGNVETYQQTKLSYEKAKNAMEEAISIHTKTYINA